MTHAILTPEAHGTLRVRTDRGADLGDAVMSSLVVPDEFRQLQNEYLILFRQNQERDGFVALAMFGFEAGENLYLDGDRWDARYRPLAMAIQPFLIGGAPDGSGPRQVHVDLASPRIAAGGEGVRVFDEHGRPSPYLETVIDQLGALDEGYRASAAFFAALDRHALLEPLSVDVTLADGARHRLVGFHVIDEDRLRALEPAALAELHAEGHLLPIFMAVASIANLGALVARRNRRMGHG
jgi:hypothetical protein